MTSENNNSVKESVGKLVYLLFGPAAKEAGDALGDYVRGVLYPWRMNNLEKIAAKAQERIGNTQTIPLPPKTAMEFVDAASMDDDEVLQVLWASLLARYLINGAEKREPFVGILRQLTPTEAKIFKGLYQYVTTLPTEEHLSKGLDKATIMNSQGLSEDDYVIAHQDMLNVGIITYPSRSTSIRVPGGSNLPILRGGKQVAFPPAPKTHRISNYLVKNDAGMILTKLGLLFGDYVIAPSLARGGGEPDKGAD